MVRVYVAFRQSHQHKVQMDDQMVFLQFLANLFLCLYVALIAYLQRLGKDIKNTGVATN